MLTTLPEHAFLAPDCRPINLIFSKVKNKVQWNNHETLFIDKKLLGLSKDFRSFAIVKSVSQLLEFICGVHFSKPNWKDVSDW